MRNFRAGTYETTPDRQVTKKFLHGLEPAAISRRYGFGEVPPPNTQLFQRAAHLGQAVSIDGFTGPSGDPEVAGPVPPSPVRDPT